MAYQNNIRVLHRKEWQIMTPAPAASAAGTFIIKDPLGIKRTTMFCVSATVHYLYATDEDAWMQVPSMALAGTWAVGACGCWIPWSNTLTASGGTTLSLTTATSIDAGAYGETIRFLTGANAGLERVCTGFLINPNSGAYTLTFSVALPNVVSAGDTFAVSTGRYIVLNAYTALAAGVIKTYDPLTGVVTSLGTTNLPASWGTDGKMCGTPSYVGSYATGTASAGGATTLTDVTKAWTVDQWINYQIRITAGTGIGQIRTITDSDATSVTVAAWTTPPDNTSVYAIEGNDDYLYLTGNGAVTLYRYSFSGASWTVLNPSQARAAAPSSGMSLNWAGKTGNAGWSNENVCLDGKYLYSFRGGSTADLHRYNIPLNTWDTITYIGKQETFGSGSAFDFDTGKIFCRKDATNRFFYYDIAGNFLYPFNTNLYGEGAAVIGDKIFTASYSDGGGSDTITWLYSLANTGTALHRIMVF